MGGGRQERDAALGDGVGESAVTRNQKPQPRNPKPGREGGEGAHVDAAHPTHTGRGSFGLRAEVLRLRVEGIWVGPIDGVGEG